MDQNQWQRVEELLQQALDLETSERKVFLDRACGPDSHLRRQVEMLLGKEDEARSFIETPAVAHVAASLVNTARTSLTGKRISHYRIDSLIGEGGMGEVYKAYDENLHREVALKMLPAEFVKDSERAQRFEQEAFTTSKLNHPNIVTIFEIVRADGSQFIASEYVEGQTLRQLLTDEATGKPRRVKVEQAIDIATQIASALRAAHTAWIIHRDIKPENIMVRADGVVKVLDFGIAKLGGSETLAPPPSVLSKEQVVSREAEGANGFKTIPGAIVGTASYMSPEQARGEQLDGRTDVFSLGAILYEMVSGERLLGPATSSGAAHSEQMPLLSPRPLDGVSRELGRIIRKAIRREREERYGSAAEILYDLQRLKQRLDNRSARRIAKASAAALLSVMALAIISAWASRGETWDERILRDGHTAAVRRAVFSPDGTRLVSVGEDHQVIVWDFARRQRLKTLTDHTGVVNAITFSPDGKWFATASDDRTVIVWDSARLERLAVLREHQGPVCAVAFSPDGRFFLSASPDPSGVTIIWETAHWSKIRELPIAVSYGNIQFLQTDGWLADNAGRVWDWNTGVMVEDHHKEWHGNWATISPDGARWASVDAEGLVKLVNLKQQKLIATQHAHYDHGRSAAFSPDGKLLATGAERVILWDAATLRKIVPLEYESVVWSVAFSPDGRWLVSTHGDGAILVWDVWQRERIANLREHSGAVRGVTFSSDGKHLASASEDQSIIVWDRAQGRREAVLTGHSTRVAAVAFSPDNQWLASADQDGNIIRWNLARQQADLIIKPLESSEVKACYFVAISPDGRSIATTHGVYDSDSGKPIMSLIGDWRIVYGGAFTADGRLVCVTDGGYVLVWDAQTRQLTARQRWAEKPIVTLSLSPDGQYLATGDDGGSVRFGSLSPLRQLSVLGRQEARIKSVAFSPDAATVASSGDDKMISLWDINRRRLITHIGTHTSPVYALAFSPDGRQLISGEHDRSVRMYTRHRTMWGFRFD